MFVTKEAKKQTKGLVPPVKRQNSQDTPDSTRESANAPGSTHFLQRNMGNSYIQSVARGQCTLGGLPKIQTKNVEEIKIQPKLTIGPANDVYEQEADRIAEQVVRMPDSSSGAQDRPNAGINIQRIPASGGNSLESDTGIRLDPNGGHPLSALTRRFMEPRFGLDFGHVRLHTNQPAHETASKIQARAFTYGNHILLGKRESEQNKKLMAHELTHVVQQSVGLNKPMIQRVVRFSVNDPLKINNWTAGATTRSGPVWRIVYGDLELESDIHAEADAPAELANWEVGFMQTERIEWNRRYWHRPNTDRRGRFLERKLKIPPAPLRDHVSNAVWYAPSAFASVSTHAAGGTTADVSLTTTDRPRSSMPISALTRSGDVSDGTDNSYQFRAGMNFVNYVSAHNAATNEWRHLELIYRSVQAAVDFQSDPAAGVVVSTDNRTLGQSRRFRWSRAADQPAIGATLANDYVNDPSNWTLNRVEGWT